MTLKYTETMNNRQAVLFIGNEKWVKKQQQGQTIIYTAPLLLQRKMKMFGARILNKHTYLNARWLHNYFFDKESGGKG